MCRHLTSLTTPDLLLDLHLFRSHAGAQIAPVGNRIARYTQTQRLYTSRVLAKARQLDRCLVVFVYYAIILAWFRFHSFRVRFWWRLGVIVHSVYDPSILGVLSVFGRLSNHALL